MLDLRVAYPNNYFLYLFTIRMQRDKLNLLTAIHGCSSPIGVASGGWWLTPCPAGELTHSKSAPSPIPCTHHPYRVFHLLSSSSQVSQNPCFITLFKEKRMMQFQMHRTMVYTKHTTQCICALLRFLVGPKGENNRRRSAIFTRVDFNPLKL